MSASESTAAKSPAPVNWDELPDNLTVEEVIPILRITRTHAYDSVNDGSIPSIRLGRAIRIPKAALMRKLGITA